MKTSSFKRQYFLGFFKCLLVMLIFFGWVNNPLHAKEKRKNKECQLISSQQAIKKAQRITKGKVVSIKLNRSGKRSVYKVRVLVKDKRIKNLSIKACR